MQGRNSSESHEFFQIKHYMDLNVCQTIIVLQLSIIIIAIILFYCIAIVFMSQLYN